MPFIAKRLVMSRIEHYRLVVHLMRQFVDLFNLVRVAFDAICFGIVRIEQENLIGILNRFCPVSVFRESDASLHGVCRRCGQESLYVFRVS